MKYVWLLVLMLIPSVVMAKTEDKINREVDDAIAFLAGTNEQDRPFIKFFSLYSIPENLTFTVPAWEGSPQKETHSYRFATEKVLSFVIHSLSYGLNIFPPEYTPVSETLMYVDIRNYGWTPEAWDIISLADPYFVEPAISYERATALQLLTIDRTSDKQKKIRGFPIVRADWFITHLTDTSKQVDIDEKAVPLYYVLLYAETGIPKNIDEYRKFWAIDPKVLQSKQGRLNGHLVVDGKSGVAIHNRQLVRARTNIGYHYETSDVKNSVKDRDFIEILQEGVLTRDVKDASEIITSNFVGMQVYFLTDGKGNRVEEGAGSVVSNKLHSVDTRVKTARSCMECHSYGLNKAENSWEKVLSNNLLKLKNTDYEKAKKAQAFYFSQFNKWVEDDNQLFKDAMFQINGLHPASNAALFASLIAWYERPLDLEQVILELGVDKAVYIDKVTSDPSFRLNAVLEDHPVPMNRQSWEDKLFQQAVKQIYRNDEVQCIISIESTHLMDGAKKVFEVKLGQTLPYLGKQGEWIKTKFNNQTVFVHQSAVEVVPKEK